MSEAHELGPLAQSIQDKSDLSNSKSLAGHLICFGAFCLRSPPRNLLKDFQSAIQAVTTTNLNTLHQSSFTKGAILAPTQGN